MSKPIVYIASPYSVGDPSINARFQCITWDALMQAGLVWPVAPLWSHLQHLVLPRTRYDDWVAYDLALLERYDAVLRLAAVDGLGAYHVHESPGADGEVEFARGRGMPVFFSIDALHDWARAEGGATT